MRQNAFVALVLTSTLAALAAGCGLDAMPSKMDKTNDEVGEMNDKMDKTNDGLDHMGTKMDETNGGLGETNDELDRTNAQIDGMSGKLDQTNAGLDGMSGQLNDTNAGIAGLGDQLTDTNDQLADTNDELSTTNNSLLTLLAEMRKTNDGLDQMNDQMAVTNAAVHNQILLLSVQEMLKPENTLVLFPPVGMMPAGQKFADEASGEEILALTHAWTAEIESANLDPDALRAEGRTEAEIAKMTADLEHAKQAKLAGLQVIAGLMGQRRVEEIARHVAENGRYQRAGLGSLMLRSSFVTMMLLDGGLFSERLTLHGQMVEAVRLVAELDYMGRLPFAERIAFTTGRTGTIQLEPKPLLTRLYGELDQRFDDDLDPVYFLPDQADPLLQRQGSELRTLREKVRENLAYWQSLP